MRLFVSWKTLTATAVIVMIATSNMTCAAAQDISASATPDQLAAAIARTMTATKPTPAANSPIEQEFSVSKNIVERRTIFKDGRAFANAAAQRQRLQIGATRYMCKAERLAYLKRGVVFHDVFRGPGSADVFTFDIDDRACVSLEKPIVADMPTRTALAHDVAKTLPNEHSFPGSQFAGLTTNGGDIRLSYNIVALAFVDFFKYKSSEIRGKTQGMFCTKYGDSIHRGVNIHVIYQMDGGAPVLEFTVDNSIC